MNIVVAGDGKVKTAVRGKEREHVVKEAHTGLDAAFAGAVQIQG